ncbi:putative membrane protein [Dissulfuribacter thermophilus]|uniref:TVP38/TMEM64 family membrane protein n=1 Tax=Dissulfuribacter thermophilus TaxID=1156395 RepID=A0A1B9F7V2_9BACT|nr:TVP38/TMEM64 family protein [Dissulfuribacter thermophilus]OCC16019.1 putative membrane protein [Dissulfuribacter thermophilus]
MTKTKKRNIKIKIAVVAIIGTLIILFWYFDLRAYLTLDYIKASKEKLLTLYEQRPLFVISTYMAIYIVTTALSLPGATIITLAGAAIFGLLKGTLIVSFASTIGATLACAVSRFVLRDWVQAKIGPRLKKINDGIEKEGIFYLFTLRLVPLFPFWVINLAMGLTNIPLRTFYWVSQLGMLPGTIVYVNAGTELAKIESLGDIMSPRLIISFALLGLFPLIAKKVLTYIKNKRRT